MKITKIYFLALVLLSFIGTALEARSKKIKQAKPQSATLPSNEILNGPCGLSTKSICPPCPSFTCPLPTPTGATGCTGPTCTCTPETAAPFCCINVTNNATVQGGLNIGSASVIGDLTVGLNANFKDDLTVEEDAIFVKNVCIEGDKAVGEDVTIQGFAVVLGPLQVNTGGLSASGPVTINGNDFINGSITVSGNQGVSGTINVGGAATFNGLLVASGGLSVFNGQTINSGGLIILNPSGCTGCTGAIISGNVFVNGNVIADDVNVSGELTVDELATLNNATTATGNTLITNGPVIMNDGLTIASGDEVMKGGSKIVGGNLSVGGDTTFESPIFANQGASINNGLIVNDGTIVDSLTITSGNLSVSGVLFVSGPITSENGTSTLSSLTITDTTNSLCPSGPAALVVLGGAGIGASGRFGRDLWLGGAEYFANTEAEGGTPTSLDYYEESCYSTSFTWGGLTVNPPANVMVRVIRVGNIVNLLVPSIIYNNPGLHIDVITSTNPMPERFRPFVTVRGAASTIISNFPTEEEGPIAIGGLGEFNVSPAGIIIFGLPATASGPLGNAANALGPQRIFSQDFVQSDINTITYNINGCESRCKAPCP